MVLKPMTFLVTVELEHREGKYASRDELAELVGQELEQADPSEVEGSDGGRYEVISYEVAPHE